MEADDLLCSRNARPQKALVGRAQSETNRTTPFNGMLQAKPSGSQVGDTRSGSESLRSWG